jgi:hypothetical protein
MNRQVAVLAAVFLFGLATGATAATSSARHAVQMTDYTQMTQGPATDPDCSIAGSFRGKPYCFGSDGPRRRIGEYGQSSHHG